jgi:hypothetical protein
MPLSDDDIDEAWNAILLDFPVENIALLQEIKKHYQAFDHFLLRTPTPPLGSRVAPGLRLE